MERENLNMEGKILGTENIIIISNNKGIKCNQNNNI
jgi:hypothetical protein